ncbi:MAG: hypothetical protein GMKNLPBB_01061 [Myxococcota bacterium]|nr:hypothetical protein [Myxococcota bacterium]
MKPVAITLFALACVFAGCKRAEAPTAASDGVIKVAAPASSASAMTPGEAEEKHPAPATFTSAGRPEDLLVDAKDLPTVKDVDFSGLTGPAEPFARMMRSLGEGDVRAVVESYAKARRATVPTERLARQLGDPMNLRLLNFVLGMARIEARNVNVNGDKAEWTLVARVPDLQKLQQNRELIRKYGVDLDQKPPEDGDDQAKMAFALKREVELVRVTGKIVKENPDAIPWEQKEVPVRSIREDGHWLLDLDYNESRIK